MTRPRAAPAAALALLALAGCGNLQVQESGAVDPGRQPLPGGLPMSFDRLGDVRIAERRIDLPKRREVERFGLTVVDVTSLHRLAPPHLLEHRLVVSSIERPSPLAAAGLRPFDAVTALDGRPVESLDDLVTRLGAKEPGEAARLSVVRPGGQTAEVTAEAAERVTRSGGFRVPLLVERQSSGAGHALGLGPLDALFYYRSALEHWAVPRGAPAPDASPFPPVDQELAIASRSRFGRRFEWGALLNMFLWESDVDLQTGEERGRFRLFWVLSFGDELTPRGGGA
ncbi:MAG: PDZ domain-containing protein [Planctomycetota bacterium]|nr:PDZ domain-containing protein [Planctomycetota bacterium]